MVIASCSAWGLDWCPKWLALRWCAAQDRKHSSRIRRDASRCSDEHQPYLWCPKQGRRMERQKTERLNVLSEHSFSQEISRACASECLSCIECMVIPIFSTSHTPLYFFQAAFNIIFKIMEETHEDRSKGPCKGLSQGWPLKCFKSGPRKTREPGSRK